MLLLQLFTPVQSGKNEVKALVFHVQSIESKMFNLSLFTGYLFSQKQTREKADCPLRHHEGEKQTVSLGSVNWNSNSDAKHSQGPCLLPFEFQIVGILSVQSILSKREKIQRGSRHIIFSLHFHDRY